MTFATPEPIVSGLPYVVTQVAGHEPTGLTDFVTESEFTIEQEGRVYEVHGCGVAHQESVRFHEKDLAHDGKDIRVWRVSRGADGQFLAEHAASF